MANGKKKIKKIAEFALDAAMPFGSIVNPALRKVGKEVGGRVACQKKGGRWVQGKCIAKGAMAKSEIKPLLKGPGSRTGRKKYSNPPKRSSY